MKKKNDKKLMQELKAGRESAFNRCFHQYYPYVACIVGNIAGKALSIEDKEEIITDIFLSLWNNRAHLDDRQFDSLKPYLGTLARNRAKDALRKLPRTPDMFLDTAIQISTEENLEEALLRQEILACLKNTISELTSREQTCFIAYYYYGKSIAVISLETGIPSETVKSHLHRSRKKLKEKLEKKGFHYAEYQSFF